jgi:formylglycine-generating enzyme
LNTDIETTNSLGIKLVLVPPGEFQMGMTGDQVEAFLEAAKDSNVSKIEQDRARAAMPRHRVIISKPLLVGATEVTVGQFRQFIKASGFRTEGERDGKGGVSQVGNEEKWPQSPDSIWSRPGYQQADDYPVVLVSWSDAIEFCNWLSEQEKPAQAYLKDANGVWIRSGGSGYRIPTEAEWEYACRAGTTTQYNFGDNPNLLEQHAWVRGNSDAHPHPVALKPANAFGLFDMHGNVYERCQDWMGFQWYDQSPTIDPQGPSTASSPVRIHRGGHCNCLPILCTSAARANQYAWYRNNRSGFRIVVPPAEAPPAAASRSADERGSSASSP